MVWSNPYIIYAIIALHWYCHTTLQCGETVHFSLGLSFLFFFEQFFLSFLPSVQEENVVELCRTEPFHFFCWDKHTKKHSIPRKREMSSKKSLILPSIYVGPTINFKQMDILLVQDDVQLSLVRLLADHPVVCHCLHNDLLIFINPEATYKKNMNKRTL